ncbi:MAG: Thioredoxin C-1 [Candidatus Heimdallarchaeota archaeon LC_3]|nr:MAG: Thioredoxin C-1 [Candidatus Heimdallarchaeota archaeon LC_3]
MVDKIDLKEFQELIQNDSTPLVVDCYADWCQPCKYSSPLFEKMSKEFPLAKFVKVNVDEQPQLAGAFQVRGVPSFFVLRGKNVVGSVVGADIKKLEKLVRKEIEAPTILAQ